jgi:hypothetical protein
LVWHSVSPRGAALIVFWPKFICIYLASEFPFLLSHITWLHFGFQFVSLLLFPLDCCLYSPFCCCCCCCCCC